jgi:hypothetical protein
MLNRRFRIQDVEPGMILDKPAISAAGRVILTEGTVLTDKLIARLQNWDIYAVDISGEQKNSSPNTRISRGLPKRMTLPLEKFWSFFGMISVNR